MRQYCAGFFISRITYACLPLQSIGGADVIMELFAAVEQRFNETAQVLHTIPLEQQTPLDQGLDADPACRCVLLFVNCLLD